jgi:hypothetical protein
VRDEFSLESYAALLSELRARGYRDVEFTDADPASPHLVLRHDVDMTLDSAVRMAEVEAGLGMQSEYFVLLRSGLYNPFSESGELGIRRILELGHRLGLHFDASLYPGRDQGDLDRLCVAECAQLESWFGISVRMVSFHRPAPAFLGLDRDIGGRGHTYQPRYFKDIAYCSDSRGGWHHGHPLDMVGKAGRALQLLTHPVWWDSRGRETPAERLDRLAAERHDFFRNELARNCQPYAKALKDKFTNGRDHGKQ